MCEKSNMKALIQNKNKCYFVFDLKANLSYSSIKSDYDINYKQLFEQK